MAPFLKAYRSITTATPRRVSYPGICTWAPRPIICKTHWQRGTIVKLPKPTALRGTPTTSLIRIDAVRVGVVVAPVVMQATASGTGAGSGGYDATHARMDSLSRPGYSAGGGVDSAAICGGESSTDMDGAG